jgi:hypothetical protein
MAIVSSAKEPGITTVATTCLQRAAGCSARTQPFITGTLATKILSAIGMMHADASTGLPTRRQTRGTGWQTPLVL